MYIVIAKELEIMRKSIKKSISLFLAAVMLIVGLPVAGLTFEARADDDTEYNGTEYGNTGIYYEISNGEVTITDADDDIETANIPGSIRGYPVTRIGFRAFCYCFNLTSITIPDSVTSIGTDAFFETEWYYLQPDGDVYAGKVYYKYKGELLTDTRVKIKYGTKGIADSAFGYCSELTSVTIPNSVTRIGNGAFDWCTGLTSITIPNSVMGIGNSAFSGCTGLTSITIGNSVISIGNGAFYGCTGLTSVTIPDSVVIIDKRAFNECTSLTSVTIGNSVASIGESAFGMCTGLTSITIPSSVTNIGDGAFDSCYGLQSLSVVEGNTIYHSQNDCIIETKSKTLIVGCKNSIIPTDGSLTSIGSGAFSGCGGLTNVTIPEGVTSIGSGAFFFCVGLTSVTIPDGITSIDGVAFYGCISLSNVTIPDSVTSIGYAAFSDCTSLTSITIPDSVTSIGEYAFGYYHDEEVEVNGIDGFVVKGFRNTAAETYANENGFKFVALGEEHTHKYIGSVIKKATCTADGIKAFTCNCGKTYTKTIPATGHKAVTDKAVAATCTKKGKTAGSYCSVCGIVIKSQKSVQALGHKYKTTTTKATTSKNGKTVTACTVCKKVSKTAVIYKASSVKLSKTSYTYNGKAQKPKVVVKTSKGKALTEGKDYTVKYQSGRKNPGTYTVTVTFKGSYSGKKTLTFTIAPKAPTLKATAAKKSARLSWSKQAGATGYNVYMATSKNGKYSKIAAVKSGKVSYTKTGLTKGRTYYFKVAAYTTSGGRTISSAYSAVKSVKAK